MCGGPIGELKSWLQQWQVSPESLAHLGSPPVGTKGGRSDQIHYQEVVIGPTPGGLLSWVWEWRQLLRMCVGKKTPNLLFQFLPCLGTGSALPLPLALHIVSASPSFRTAVESLMVPGEKLWILFARTPRLKSWSDKKNTIASEFLFFPLVVSLFAWKSGHLSDGGLLFLFLFWFCLG